MIQGQKNTFEMMIENCIKEKAIDIVSFDFDLTGNVTEKTFIKL